LLDHAAENGYGIPASNVNNLETGAVDHGGGHTKPTAPVILQRLPRAPVSTPARTFFATVIRQP